LDRKYKVPKVDIRFKIYLDDYSGYGKVQQYSVLRIWESLIEHSLTEVTAFGEEGNIDSSFYVDENSITFEF
jgi:hypothetical protein